MDDLRIRTALPADAEAVLAFWAVAAEGTSVSDDPAGVRTLLSRDPQALLLAEAEEPGGTPGGRLVGTVIAGFDGWRCHLYRLAVHPSYRRRGVASALLAAAERRFTALGGRRADAMVLERNVSAHPAWYTAGYRSQPEWRRWVKPLPAPGQ